MNEQEHVSSDEGGEGLEASRNWWRIRADQWMATATRQAARAESAEAALDAARRDAEGLRARLGALADTWERDDEESLNRFGQHLMGGSVLSCAEHLRAALANPPTGDTQ